MERKRLKTKEGAWKNATDRSREAKGEQKKEVYRRAVPASPLAGGGSAAITATAVGAAMSSDREAAIGKIMS